ncbi:uncharacterized protein BO88DRAFT_427233 [Aspergillus vadensis CBS 113365]|uniref:Uncharacterized protein n=1 Tax=Aspergillus vadensis (strain CBS 113365 / IMI 142717 / IBT 24658) TaxID=1448311 RepID=A0A319B5E8_ASPVC|nr:hypothetical protein BO88DRAFT_427233 [Aspergillus vadensis CBS 113365]PYH67024.1 hypothetical protein BO88DRAFT_427233 [Aspergillus vadensis CBS 113365]
MNECIDQYPTDLDILIIKAWGQGFLVDSFIIIITITAANIKKEVFLHRLIIAEVDYTIFLEYKIFIFFYIPAQDWYLLVTAIINIYANFAFFNWGQVLYTTTRLLKLLFQCSIRIFTTCFLLYVIQRGYGYLLVQLIYISSYFGVILLFMVISVVFAVVDMCIIQVKNCLGYPPGMELFWKEATHARGRSINQLVEYIPKMFIKCPEPVCRPPDMV